MTLTAKNLMHLFFVQEQVKKTTKKYDVSTAKPVINAAVLGSGLMGAGIAWLFSYRQIKVRLKDVDWKVLLKGTQAIKKIYKQMIKRRSLTKSQANMRYRKTVSTTTDYSGFNHSD